MPNFKFRIEKLEQMNNPGDHLVHSKVTEKRLQVDPYSADEEVEEVEVTYLKTTLLDGNNQPIVTVLIPDNGRQDGPVTPDEEADARP